MEEQRIVVNILVKKPVDRVWKCWTGAEDIQQWNIPFKNWQCRVAYNNLFEGGSFCFEMGTRDGKEGFDFAGRYDNIIPYELVAYTLNDGRKSTTEFQQIDENTILRESFEPEKNVPNEIQQQFCESVLLKFKRYLEER